jgi:hypothetical protein
MNDVKKIMSQQVMERSLVNALGDVALSIRRNTSSLPATSLMFSSTYGLKGNIEMEHIPTLIKILQSFVNGDE